MDPAIYGFVGTLVGAIVGALASIGVTVINSWNSSRLQFKSDELNRIERARIFQRDTLLDLQEYIQNGMRSVSQLHYHEVMSYRKVGCWGKARVDEDLNQRFLKINQQLSTLTERISDDELRNCIKHFRSQLSGCIFSESLSESEMKIKHTSDECQQLMEKLGRVLREHY